MRARRAEPRGGSAGRALACVGLVVALAFGVATAQGRTRLVGVRVGVHPGYARVVLETDVPARYELATLNDADRVIYLGAMSTSQSLPAREPGAPSVEVAAIANGATAVRIQTPTPVRVETQVLDSPPRLVFDLRPTPAAHSESAPPEPPAPIETPPPPESPPTSAPPEVSTPPTSEVPPPVGAPLPVVAEPPPTPPEPAATPEPSPPAPAPPEPVAELPAVGSAPSAAIALEPRSLATGIALGFALALFAFATRRPRATPSAAEAAVAPPAPAEVEAVAAEPTPLEDLHDFVRMHERLDRRLAETATRLAAIAARQDQLGSQESAQNAELAAQRVAIARLKLALRPAGVAPRRPPERVETTSR